MSGNAPRAGTNLGTSSGHCPTPGRAAEPDQLPHGVSDVVAQPRVSATLDQWAPITVVRGMQGYGKTTVVLAWLRNQATTTRILWFTVTGLGDPSSEIAGQIQRHLDVTASPLSISGPGERDELQDAEPADGTRTVIVIDDAHRLRDETVLRWLLALVEHRASLHLILCSRGHHPMQTLADGRSELVTTPASALLFTPSQTPSSPSV